MKKYSQKPTSYNLNDVSKSQVAENSNQQYLSTGRTGSSTPPINKFEGMAERAEIIPPVFIPGYRVIG